MPIINYPVQNVTYYAVNEVYLRADNATVTKYCADNGLTLVSYESEKRRFSNDGGLAYQYWGLPVGVTGGTNAWITEFGYSQIVTELRVS
jgi:hypothetical protein